MKPSPAAFCFLLFHLVLPLISCQESTRSPYGSTKIDVVCSKALGCISDCQQTAFCLDGRVYGKSSPSYILDDHVLFLRAHVVRLTNDSVVALIHESFGLPLSLFSSETFDSPAVRQAREPSIMRLFDTFAELQLQDKTLSDLRVGDPYCVWQRKMYSYPDIGNCLVSSTEEGQPAVGTVFQTTGSFGFTCRVRRFRRRK